MKHNDGGPAFPRPASEYTGSGTCPDGNDALHDQAGMSLRDWYAGVALQGIVAAYSGSEFPLPSPEEAASRAFAYADAMLAQARK